MMRIARMCTTEQITIEVVVDFAFFVKGRQCVSNAAASTSQQYPMIIFTSPPALLAMLRHSLRLSGVELFAFKFFSHGLGGA